MVIQFDQLITSYQVSAIYNLCPHETVKCLLYANFKISVGVVGYSYTVCQLIYKY